MSNADQTRWFLVLRARRPPNDELNRLLHLSNRLLAKFGQPPLYAKPSDTNDSGAPTKLSTRSLRNCKRTSNVSTGGGDYSDHFHISIGWKLEKPTDEEEALTQSLDTGELAKTPLSFDSMKAKIGNTISNVKLPVVDHDDGNGFIGASH